jgi:hypothetical protein
VFIALASIGGEGWAEYFGSCSNDIVVNFDKALITGANEQAASAIREAATADARTLREIDMRLRLEKQLKQTDRQLVDEKKND